MLLINGRLNTNTQALLFGFNEAGPILPLDEMMGRAFSGVFPSTAAAPAGYDMTALIPPRNGAELASVNQTEMVLTATATSGVQLARDFAGSAEMSLTCADADLSLEVNLSGSTSMALTATATPLGGSVSLEGSTSATLTCTGELATLVSFEGSTSMSLTASGNLTGLASLEYGAPTPAELTAPLIATAVWQELLGGAITAEDAMLAAGSAGDPWSAVIDGQLAAEILAQIKVRIRDLHQINALNQETPVVHEPGSITAGDIVIELSGDNVNSRTRTRRA